MYLIPIVCLPSDITEEMLQTNLRWIFAIVCPRPPSHTHPLQHIRTIACQAIMFCCVWGASALLSVIRVYAFRTSSRIEKTQDVTVALVFYFCMFFRCWSTGLHYWQWLRRMLILRLFVGFLKLRLLLLYIFNTHPCRLPPPRASSHSCSKLPPCPAPRPEPPCSCSSTPCAAP